MAKGAVERDAMKITTRAIAMSGSFSTKISDTLSRAFVERPDQ